MTMTRRGFTILPIIATVSSCSAATAGARLTARPLRQSSGTMPKPGVHPLDMRRERRDTLLYVPKVVKPGCLLVVYLHGAGGDEQQGVKRLGAVAEELGFLLLSPASEGRTWDAIRGDYGVDVRLIDRSLAKVFAITAVSHVTLAGFSDGASYGLGLGMQNGDLFQSVAAFSPGFIPDSAGLPSVAKPRIFISHGTEDEILPIESCSRRLVPRIKQAGYEVRYVEFAGGHTFSAALATEGLK